MTHLVKITKPGVLCEAIAKAQQSGADHLLPVLRAVLAGELTWLYAEGRHAAFPKKMVRQATRPTLLIVGDDDGACTGPDGWRCAAAAARWARGAIVHATGARAEHYALAVEGARGSRRFLLVETIPEFAPAWLNVIGRDKPVTLIAPPSGGSHPVMPTGALQ